MHICRDNRMTAISMAVVVLTMLVATIACTQANPDPAPTYTPYPTYTPAPTPIPVSLPTYTPPPTATAYPTYTPQPTLVPLPTHTPYPTHTPLPTYTPYPTRTPSPSINWERSGYWYRDVEWETELLAFYRNEDPEREFVVKIATLDADPSQAWGDLALALGCINDHPVGYLVPYSFEVPANIDTWTIGVWDRTAERWDDDFPIHPAVVTDDGSGVYITNRAIMYSIVELLGNADAELTQSQAFSAGMWASATDESGLWGSFNPEGLQDALDYLGCY